MREIKVTSPTITYGHLRSEPACVIRETGYARNQFTQRPRFRVGIELLLDSELSIYASRYRSISGISEDYRLDVLEQILDRLNGLDEQSIKTGLTMAASL
jgi:hypothetical protein